MSTQRVFDVAPREGANGPGGSAVVLIGRSRAASEAFRRGQAPVVREYPEPPEDEAGLIERVKAGETAAFDELVRRYMRRALAVAYRVLGQREDAEDVTQEAFLAVLDKIGTFDSSRPFGPWLYRIVMNRSINARKARTLRRAEPIAEDAPASGDTPARSYERQESRERLERALRSLPERQRLIVRLFEVDGFSSAEIGAMLDLSDGTVRWHLHQARAALRKSLAAEEHES